MSEQKMQRAVKWYPPAYDIRVETVPIPSIQHPDDAIVKVQLAGLCGSDLHVYRGHEDVDAELICGHEFVGTVVALGGSFSPLATARPELYSTLKIGDKVVSPFTTSCGECHFCRVGFTCRCVHSTLFGIPTLPGGQAQYVRVPKAGGTLLKVESIIPAAETEKGLRVADSSLILLADILPTGVFAALQALQHAKLSPMLSGIAYPASAAHLTDPHQSKTVSLASPDQTLTFAIVGLGPVGVCAAVSLLHMLGELGESKGFEYKVLAIDPLESRREKMHEVLLTIHGGKLVDQFVIEDIENGKKVLERWTDGMGCNAVLEIVGNPSALRLAYDLVRPFGTISSVGVHQEPPLPFIGREMYNKNVSFDFGRCPVRAMLPIASDILWKRQDVFGGIGEKASLIEKIVSFNEAAEYYALFDKGKTGKILFDPWM